MGRVCRLLGLMIESGVPLVNSLRLAQSASGNTLYAELFADLEQQVLNGNGLGETMAASNILPPSAAEMIATGEKTGNMGSVADLLGEHYEDEGETRMRELVTIIEPLITVGMGVIVAIVVLSVMLPMFDLATLSHN